MKKNLSTLAVLDSATKIVRELYKLVDGDTYGKDKDIR